MPKKIGDKPILLRASRQCLRALYGPEPSQGTYVHYSFYTRSQVYLFLHFSQTVRSAVVFAMAAG